MEQQQSNEDEVVGSEVFGDVDCSRGKKKMMMKYFLEAREFESDGNGGDLDSDHVQEKKRRRRRRETMEVGGCENGDDEKNGLVVAVWKKTMLHPSRQQLMQSM